MEYLAIIATPIVHSVALNNNDDDDDNEALLFYNRATVVRNATALDASTRWSVRPDPLPPVATTQMGHPTKPWPVYRQETYVVALLVVAHAAVGVIGIVNNSFVIFVILRDAKMRSVTNYFIANLAFADLLVCVFVLPITLFQNIYSEWWCGWMICKSVPYLQGVSVSASVNTLAGVAFERYLAIFHSSTRKMSPHSARICLAAIWAVPAALFIPWLMVYEVKTYSVSGFEYVVCHAAWNSQRLSRAFLTVVFLTCYLFPLTTIGLVYLRIGSRVWKRRVVGQPGSSVDRSVARSRSRILKMLVVVVMLFTVSWFPLYSVKFRVLFGPALTRDERSVVVNYLTPLAQWMGASNSCVNPFVYCYFSMTFRREFRAAVSLCCPQSRGEPRPRAI